jgi:GR25 family glycosyltransferase involved in LPS biosynthesis
MRTDSGTYFGVYINLDRSQDRRAAIEAQLVKIGLDKRYERLSAVDGVAGLAANMGHGRSITPGELGCWLSHRFAWARCLQRSNPCHVMEDDAVLSDGIGDRIQAIVNAVPFEQWDIIFTDLASSSLDETMRIVRDVRAQRTRGKFAILPLETNTTLSGTASYIVNPRSAARLLDLVHPDKHDSPVDLLIRHFVNSGQISAFVTTPFLTTISGFAEQSQISTGKPGGEDDDRILRAAMSFRRSLYIQADPAASIAEISAVAEPIQSFEAIMMGYLSRCLTEAPRRK